MKKKAKAPKKSLGFDDDDVYYKRKHEDVGKTVGQSPFTPAERKFKKYSIFPEDLTWSSQSQLSQSQSLSRKKLVYDEPLSQSPKFNLSYLTKVSKMFFKVQGVSENEFLIIFIL